jgi:hypothetical protein
MRAFYTLYHSTFGGTASYQSMTRRAVAVSLYLASLVKIARTSRRTFAGMGI